MDTKPKGADWEAQVLRVSIFLRSAFDASAIWQDLVGQKPDVDDLRPREGRRIQNGNWKDAILEVQVIPARIDIVWTASPSAEGTISFGEFNSRATEFLGLILPWLNKAPIECVRLAFGAVVVQHAKNREEAYEILGRFLPSVKVDAANLRELMYRINRPVSSSLIEGHINRLTTWASMAIRLMTASGAGVQFQNVENHFARLECDVSSSELRSEPIPNEKLGAVLSKFVDLARENIEKGELP
jgi:hypothetical protein